MKRDNDVQILATRLRLAACAGIAALTLVGCGGGGGDGQPAQAPVGDVNPPVISSFSPAVGAVGDQVVLSGVNFAVTPSGNTVRFNGVQANVLSATSAALVAVVPAGATSGTVQVSTAGGTATSSETFTVLSGMGSSWRTRTFGLSGSSTIAYNGTRFVAVGGGAIEASSDALTWTTAQRPAYAGDVAWNGRLFVAVGGAFWFYTSTDGLTWTRRDWPDDASDMSAVAGTSSTWVAVGEGGAIFSSSDGVTWTARASGTSNNLFDVVWAANRFVAVGGAGAVVTSPDGISWTAQAAPTADSFSDVGGSSALIVAAADHGFSGSTLLTSADGVMWSAAAAADLSLMNDIVYADGRFVAAGFYQTATSIDGVAWTTSARLRSIFESLVYTGNEYVAVGADGSGSARALLRSVDGLNWSTIQHSHNLHRIARSAQDGRLLAVGMSNITRASTDRGATWSFAPLGTEHLFIDLVWAPSASAFVGHVQDGANQYAYTTTDGAVWTQRGYMPCWGALAASPTRLVNVGSSLVGACVAVSDDGASWTSITAPSSSTMQGVFWTGSQFVGVGANGLIATSPDGSSWTVRTSNVSEMLKGGAASGSVIVVVGANGAIVTSSDAGATWTARDSGVSSTLRHAAFSGTEFFVVGTGGTLLRSTTGVTWSKQPTVYNVDFGDIMWLSDASQLVLAGDSGLIATSPSQ